MDPRTREQIEGFKAKVQEEARRAISEWERAFNKSQGQVRELQDQKQQLRDMLDLREGELREATQMVADLEERLMQVEKDAEEIRESISSTNEGISDLPLPPQEEDSLPHFLRPRQEEPSAFHERQF